MKVQHSQNKTKDVWVFLKFLLSLRRFFYQFLLANERTVAKEIRDEYVDTMSKIYYSYFKSYSGRLLKVQVSAGDAQKQKQMFRVFLLNVFVVFLTVRGGGRQRRPDGSGRHRQERYPLKHAAKQTRRNVLITSCCYFTLSPENTKTQRASEH